MKITNRTESTRFLFKILEKGLKIEVNFNLPEFLCKQQIRISALIYKAKV